MRYLLPFLGLLVLTMIFLRPPYDDPVEAAGLHLQPPPLLICTGKDGVSSKQMKGTQAAWARYLGCKVEESVDIEKGVKMTFVLIPPGRFRMGSPQDEENREDDETPHTVTLSEPFYLGKYEVTQSQYEALIGKNPSRDTGADDSPVGTRPF